MTNPTSKQIADQWNPLLAQLAGAAELGSACSSLVLQSLVAQSVNVLEKLIENNDSLAGRLTQAEAEVERLLGVLTDGGCPAPEYHGHLLGERDRLRAALDQVQGEAAAYMDYNPRKRILAICAKALSGDSPAPPKSGLRELLERVADLGCKDLDGGQECLSCKANEILRSGQFAIETRHTCEEDFQHWLSYSGNRYWEVLLRDAYFAGAGQPFAPETTAQLSSKQRFNLAAQIDAACMLLRQSRQNGNPPTLAAIDALRTVAGDISPDRSPEETSGESLHDEECANCGAGWSKHLTNKLICPDAAIADVYRFRQELTQNGGADGV